MWLHFALLLIIGAALADHDHGWETGNEYQFDVHSRTVTDLRELTKESTGILLKGTLIIQAISPDTLQATISKPHYARLHQTLPDGSASRIPTEKLESRELPVSGKPFKINIKHGVIRDLLIEKDVPTWELNILKSIISQLQVDTQGENKIRSKSIQVPDDEQPFAMFRAMEDSVGGKCEVLYDIVPLSESNLFDKPELVPLPHLLGDGQHYDIMKTKNYSRCEQQMTYHFGIAGNTKWSPISNHGYVSRTSTSRVIISGNLKRFTIQSSVTVDKILINQKTHTGFVYSGVNVTLNKVDKISNPLPVSDDLVSTGNLVYKFNSPLSATEKHKTIQSIGRNSLPVSSESSKSSSEERQVNRDPEDSSSISDSSSSSASIASSNERSYLQSKPLLDQVPDNPLLPYFIGYKGKIIQNSEEVNAVKSALNLIVQLPEDIEAIRDLPAGLLEKFTILTNLIRTMNTKQIAELQEKIAKLESPKPLSDELKNHYTQSFWDILRDAVTQAGTGPAFITIRNWIKEKKLEGVEAARTISRLPKTVRTPTTEYIQAFFELIKQPEVTQESFLNTSAPLAFAELVFYAHISNTDRYNRYPIYAFGRMTPKEDQAVTETYIPYIAERLKEAIKEGDSPRIQTYIIALGNFAHPKILSVLEPYLEGTTPVSDFQRLTMVISLWKLAETNPRLAQSVAYKIYLNVREAEDIRSVAAIIVLKSNPSLATIQRMAEFTQRDDSKLVNSAVRSTIKNLAELEGSEWQDLASKARIVKKTLKLHEDDKKYSQVSFKQLLWNNVVYKTCTFFIGSDDSDIPKIEYIDLGISHGAFKLPSNRIEYMISSIKQLSDIIKSTSHGNDNEKHKPSIIEEIARKLNIQPEDPQQLEGNILFDTLYKSEFYPFDNHTIERLVNKWTEKFIKALEPGLFQLKNINHLESYDVTLGCPTETGLPFIYTLETPRLMTLSGEGKLNIKAQEDYKSELNIAGHLIIVESIQNRIGFVAPFEHHQYIAGVDETAQLFLPIGFQVEYDPTENCIQLTIHPDNYYRYGFDKITLVVSTVPYTSSYNILNLQPLLVDQGTHRAYRRKPRDVKISLIDNVNIYFSSDYEPALQDVGRDNSEILSELWGNNAYYKVAAITLKSLPGKINVTFDITETDADSEGDGETWPAIPTIADKQPDSETRRKQFLKEVSKGINSATNYIIDVEAYVPTILKDRQIFTIAVSESNVDDKSRALLYWRQVADNKPSNAEVCAAGILRSSQDIFLDPEKAIERVPTDTINVELQFGESCENGLTIRLDGNQTRSEHFKKILLNSDVAKDCQREIGQGNKGLRSCQKTIALSNIKDHTLLSIDIKSEPVNEFVHMAIQFAVHNFFSEYKHLEIVNPQNAERKTIDLEMKVSPDTEDLEFTLHTSEMDITFALLDVVSDTTVSLGDELNGLLDEKQELDVSCTIDKTKAVTFDDRTYPVKLGNCWHVIATTYPQKNPNNPSELWPIPEELQVAVLAKETGDGYKQVRILIGKYKLELTKSGDQLEATLDGQKIPLSQHKSHRVQEKDENIIEIFELPDGSIRILSDEYEVNAVYDGERIRVELSDEYRNAVRGLCGNYDALPDNDFVIPKNCVLRKPEEFIATYAITEESCEGPAIENRQKAEQSTCIHHRHSQSNVISDREAGRLWTENKKWGYHHDRNATIDRFCNLYRTNVVEEGNEICFSIKPLLTCKPHCITGELKTKSYAVHCLPKGKASTQLKNRIHLGANPNLIHRSVSRSHSFQVPLSCTPVRYDNV